MPTLEDDGLVFRFPSVEPEASFAIDFQRTLRVPDSDRDYPLPPGLGRFPVRHVEDYAVTPATAARGGVMLPIWQAEAMWLNFSCRSGRRYGGGPDFPVAIKVAAGKINAVTGEPWRPGLNRRPQDYMVAPGQPWLDGYAIEPGVVRQFVAMELGEGYSAEEQITGEARWGGLQISVCPLKAKVWERKKREWREGAVAFAQPDLCYDLVAQRAEPRAMALAPGGRMRQAIEPDPYRAGDWDTALADRVFVTLVHARDWKGVTGEPAPTTPPSAQDYARAGLPWFEWYGSDRRPLPGGGRLAGLKSVGTLHEQKTGAVLPSSGDVAVGSPVRLGPGAPRPVRAGSWED